MLCFWGESIHRVSAYMILCTCGSYTPVLKGLERLDAMKSRYTTEHEKGSNALKANFVVLIELSNLTSSFLGIKAKKEKHNRSRARHYLNHETAFALFSGEIIFFFFIATQSIIQNCVFHVALLRVEKPSPCILWQKQRRRIKVRFGDNVSDLG